MCKLCACNIIDDNNSRIIMTRKNTNKYHYVAVQLCLYELVDFARLYVALVAGKFHEESQPTDLALCSLYGYILHRRFDSNIKQVSGMCRSHLSSNDFTIYIENGAWNFDNGVYKFLLCQNSAKSSLAFCNETLNQWLSKLVNGLVFQTY